MWKNHFTTFPIPSVTDVLLYFSFIAFSDDDSTQNGFTYIFSHYFTRIPSVSQLELCVYLKGVILILSLH